MFLLYRKVIQLHIHIYIYTYFFILLLLFWLCCVACGILVLQPETEPRPTAVDSLSPNPWTSRDSLFFLFFSIMIHHRILNVIPCAMHQDLVYPFSVIVCKRHLIWELYRARQSSGGGKVSLELPPWPQQQLSQEQPQEPSQSWEIQGFPGGSVVKNPPANTGDTGLIPGVGKSHIL